MKYVLYISIVVSFASCKINSLECSEKALRKGVYPEFKIYEDVVKCSGAKMSSRKIEAINKEKIFIKVAIPDSAKTGLYTDGQHLIYIVPYKFSEVTLQKDSSSGFKRLKFIDSSW